MFIRFLFTTIFLLISMCFIKAEPATKHIAIIFDDGPTKENALKLLEIFRRENIHVTFGYIGANVEKYPDIARSVVAAGHEIANHSYAHLHPEDLTDTSLEHEVLYSQRVIVKKAHYSPKWYWPPFIEYDPRIPSIAARVNMKVYKLKNFVSSDDYNKNFTAEQIKQKATSDITDGTVILFHEWRDETVSIISEIIAELKDEGCVFMTFSELAEYLPR